MLTNGTKASEENGLSESEDESELEENATSDKKLNKEVNRQLKIRRKQDKRKLKKEGRELRAKVMSEGLENLDFSTAKFENGDAMDVQMENDVSDDETNTKKTNKRPIEEDTLNKTKKKKKNPVNKN